MKMRLLLLTIIITSTIYGTLNNQSMKDTIIWRLKQIPTYSIIQTWTNKIKHQLLTDRSTKHKTGPILQMALLISGDIQQNPGPTRNTTVNLCGLCDRPVTWSCEEVCCDDCDIWHYRSCIELCTYEYELSQRSNVQWMCYKCESLNVDSFTYRSFELYTSNMFAPLSQFSLSLGSELDNSVFNPVHTSSPRSSYSNNSKRHNTRSKSTSRSQPSNTNVFNLPPKENLRIMTINCRSIKDKKTELASCINYIKPDIICGTESWLK